MKTLKEIWKNDLKNLDLKEEVKKSLNIDLDNDHPRLDFLNKITNEDISNLDDDKIISILMTGLNPDTAEKAIGIILYPSRHDEEYWMERIECNDTFHSKVYYKFLEEGVKIVKNKNKIEPCTSNNSEDYFNIIAESSRYIDEFELAEKIITNVWNDMKDTTEWEDFIFESIETFCNYLVEERYDTYYHNLLCETQVM